LAKAINCSSHTDGSIEPCNECGICEAITNGSHIDVVEVDAASNRGIDEIRSLREKVKYAPVELSKKVYIIDEVHMLTTEAFNALLKTLEEPPSHVIFILCTTEADRLLPTIISRTFVVQFENPTSDEIKRSLMRVSEREKLSIDEDVYDTLIHLANGSFRDAHKILEEVVITSGGDKIHATTVESVFKSGHMLTLSQQLFELLEKKDAGAILTRIEEQAKGGMDFRHLTKVLCEYLQQRLQKALKTPSSKGMSVSDITILLELFMNAYGQSRGAVIPQLPLELACLSWCLDTKQTEVSSVDVAEVTKTKVTVTKTISHPLVSPKTTSSSDPAKPTIVLQAQINPHVSDKEFLTRLIDSIKQVNHSVAGLLRSSTITSLTDKILTLSLPYKFHADKLNEQKTKKIIEEHASLLLARPVTLAVITE